MSRAILRRVFPALLAGAVMVAPFSLQAQTAGPLRACYVPGSGTVYRIGASDTPADCAPGHVAFEWGGVAELSTTAAATAAANDPYPQYLLTNGVRQSNNGFAVTDHPGLTGTIPARGPGKRLLWYPEKAAFRAGAAFADTWDDPNVGHYSTAFGFATKASGYYSTALGGSTKATGHMSTAAGHGATASGGTSTAFGDRTIASGPNSTALGTLTKASGNSSTAMGWFTTASGSYSTAIGHYASTGGRQGAFVYGDASTKTPIQATLLNQFVVRAQQIWLGTNNAVGVGWGGFLETSTGASLSWGGTWTNSSDAARKQNFAAVDGEDVLAKVSVLPISTWSYKEEPDTVRHLGPTAQDFYAAFSLGNTDKAIATVDADGVSLIAIQALEKRTAELRRENEALRAELSRVLQRLTKLEDALVVR
jgi:hypothetical protein